MIFQNISKECVIVKSIFVKTLNHPILIYMTQSHYKALREVIIKAVPSIVELKFGCVVVLRTPVQPLDKPREQTILKSEGDNFICMDVWGHTFGTYLNKTHLDKILGRPIRWADICFAIGEKEQYNSKQTMVSVNGGFWDNGKLLAGYNLSKDNLDDQTDDFKQFLYDLLVQPTTNQSK